MVPNKRHAHTKRRFEFIFESELDQLYDVLVHRIYRLRSGLAFVIGKLVEREILTLHSGVALCITCSIA